MKREAVIFAAQQGCNKKEAAEALGVNWVTLWRFLQTNPDIAKMFPTKLQVEKARKPGCLTGITRQDLEDAITEGLLYTEIAEKFEVCIATVYRMIKFYDMKHLNPKKALWATRRGNNAISSP